MSYDQRAHRDPVGTPARRSGGVPDTLLVGALGLMLGVTALVWTSSGIAGWVRHGAWPEGVTFLRTAHAVRSLLTAPGDVPAAWPEAAPETLPSAALLWLVFLAQVAVLFSTVLWVVIRMAHWRARRATPRPAPEAETEPAGPVTFESEPEIPSATATPPRPEPVLRPPPVGERLVLDPVAAVLGAPEGLLVLDPDGRLWTRTARQRGRTGPIHVYDPGHASDAPVRLRWAPQRGCEDMPVARRRAAALLAPVRPAEPVFQLDAEAAQTLLRCYLHAAALGTEPLTQVQRWAHGRSAAEPAKILRTHPRAAGGAAMELESTLTSHPGRRDAALRLIARAFMGLDQLHIRQACTPGRVDTLALDNVTGEGATVYVVGDHKETAGLRGAFVDALAQDQPTLTVVGVG